MDAVRITEMCALQMEQLRDCVASYEPYRDVWFQAGRETPKNAQSNKTAIRRQITGLRQSLLALEKEICG